MRVWTFGEIKEKIELDLDMQGEDFVTDDEMMGYANEAIDEAESVIHNLNEDYFMTSDVVTMVVDEDEAALPADIFATKLRHVGYNDGSYKYEIKRIKLKDIPFVEDADPYRHIVLNRSGEQPVMKFYPPFRVAGDYITRHYIRNANRLTDSASECDIPEFTSFVINFVKVQCALKEGHPRLDAFQAELEKSRALMTTTLSEMVPDENTEIAADMSFYDEMA